MTEVEIEAFLAAATTGTISAAAKRLFITQPALSRRIHSLEEQLGYALFIRHKGIRSIELTPEGRAFLPIAERWKGLFNESKFLSQDLGLQQSFKLGVIGSMCTYIMPSTLQGFINKYPECQFTIHQHHSPECYQYVDQGLLDLALVAKEQFYKDVDSIPLFKTGFKLISKAHLAEEQVLPPSSLDIRGEIRIPWSAEFDIWHDYWFGSQVKSRVNLDMMSALEHFINDTSTWAIVPNYIAKDLKEKYQLQVYELQAAPPDITMFYLRRKDNKNKYGQIFLDIMKEQLAQNKEITLLM